MALAALVAAVSVATGPVLRVSGEIEVSAEPTAVVGSGVRAEPAVVRVARELVSEREWPRVIKSGGERWRVEEVGARRAIVCGRGECALVRRGEEKFLVNTDPRARKTLRIAAEAGEPR